MKRESQITFIKTKRRYPVDLMDVMRLGSLLFCLLTTVALLTIAYQRSKVALEFVLIAAMVCLGLGAYIFFKFTKTLFFETVQTNLSSTQNQQSVIQYLQQKDLPVLTTPLDPSVIVTQFMSVGITPSQKEMTLICLDNKVLLNIRRTEARDLFGLRPSITFFRKDLEWFIRQQPGR